MSARVRQQRASAARTKSNRARASSDSSDSKGSKDSGRESASESEDQETASETELESDYERDTKAKKAVRLVSRLLPARPARTRPSGARATARRRQ